MTSAAVSFSPRNHIYCDGNQVVPSVTQVLELASLDDVARIPLHNLQRAAGIGKAVHLACEYLDQRDLVVSSIEPEISGYVRAYAEFKKDSGFMPIGIEERGIGANGDRKFGYCVDRVGVLNNQLFLIDLKTAAKPQAWWAIQTAGYAWGIKHQGPRAALHLSKDGKYKLLRHDDARDFEVWLSALNVAHWKLANGWRIA